MNIKIVKEPVPLHSNCTGCYNHKTKTIFIKKYCKNSQKVIRHEYIHYLIDMFFIFPRIKHHLNFLYDCIYVLLWKRSFKLKKQGILWHFEYYNSFGKDKNWVY